MEMLLEKVRGTVNPKADMAKRCLQHGMVLFCIETTCSAERANGIFEEYFAPLHEKLKGDGDYDGGNIILYVEPFQVEGHIQRQIGIMFNKCDWDALPDDLEIKHGHFYLCVKNITKRNKK